jgi:hypothetical protein
MNGIIKFIKMGKTNYGTIEYRKRTTKKRDIQVSSSSKPERPKPPLSRVLRTGVRRLCLNCNSTMPKSGFLMLFGKRYCDNKKCPNSKPEKNHY